ncbi:hypothetical protein TNCT_140891 [Trichonephila clavata]|uniref:Uncharacterized protein n=1 Tax=Trichonephila clavata TaxID=2740835 RepID=A0A8X6HQU0_TRICU|nr:hypothetical protein TNCT_140891 [Trichonephila clavata]
MLRSISTKRQAKVRVRPANILACGIRADNSLLGVECCSSSVVVHAFYWFSAPLISERSALGYISFILGLCVNKFLRMCLA